MAFISDFQIDALTATRVTFSFTVNVNQTNPGRQVAWAIFQGEDRYDCGNYNPPDATGAYAVSRNRSLNPSTAYRLRVYAANTLDYSCSISSGAGSVRRGSAYDGNIFFTTPDIVNTPATGTPTISGTPAVDETLTANQGSIADANGLPSTFPDDYSFQWLRDGVAISSATARTYTVTIADAGARLSVEVSFEDNRDFDESRTSAETAMVPANNAATGMPAITGSPRVAQTLTAGRGSIADSDGLPDTFPGDYTFQWQRSTVDIPGETGTTYEVTASDVGSTLRVVVSFTDDIGFSESRASASTATVSSNASATGVPTITGTVKVGETLTANQGSIADSDGLPDTFPDDYTFQWIRGADDIVGAIASTYELVKADTGEEIKVRVSFVDDLGGAESRTSAATAAVAVPDAASAPTVTINAIPDGEENTKVTLGAALVGGNYDEVDYVWSAAGGSLNDVELATPQWTRPYVIADADVRVGNDVGPRPLRSCQFNVVQRTSGGAPHVVHLVVVPADESRAESDLRVLLSVRNGVDGHGGGAGRIWDSDRSGRRRRAGLRAAKVVYEGHPYLDLLAGVRFDEFVGAGNSAHDVVCAAYPLEGVVIGEGVRQAIAVRYRALIGRERLAHLHRARDGGYPGCRSIRGYGRGGG